MSRLTEKRKEPLTTKWKDVPTSYYKIKGDNTGVCVSEIPRLNKLGKLEDLEEELGCPLEIAFKALKDGIYTKESELDKELELYDVRGIELKGLGVISKICSYGECDFTCYYKDYKKTWWLKENREE